MVYSFITPWEVEETRNVIKLTVESMGGKVKAVSPSCVKAKWRTGRQHSKRFFTFFPSKFTFYIGDGVVRVATGNSNMQRIPMTVRLGKIHIVWNAFIESLMKVAPGVNFGIKPGDAIIVAAQFVGDGTEEVFTSTTRHSPSLGGAAIGGMLFGSTGAIIGAASGRSYTTGRSSTRFSNKVLTRVRYSNGLISEGLLSKRSPVYQEILVNIKWFSKPI